MMDGVIILSNVISKTFQLLRAFTDHQEEWGVNELARFLDMPVSSVHRMMQMLKDENILTLSNISGKYQIGKEFIRISSIVLAKSDIKRVAQPYMEDIAKTTGHSVYLSQYYEQYKKLAFIDSVRSSYALQYVLDIGVLQPIYVAASGKSILAYLETEVINDLVEKKIKDKDEKERLYAELSQIRENGYAITSHERKKGALSIGAPIFDATKKVIGSIICVIPILEYKKEFEDMYIQNIKYNASKISYLLGYTE